MLVDATLKNDMAPLALPRKEYMEHAKALWEKFGLPPLTPEPPWYGYTMGDWTTTWEAMAKRAVAGDYLENGRRSEQLKHKDIKPNTAVRSVIKDGWEPSD